MGTESLKFDVIVARRLERMALKRILQLRRRWHSHLRACRRCGGNDLAGRLARSARLACHEGVSNDRRNDPRDSLTCHDASPPRAGIRSRIPQFGSAVNGLLERRLPNPRPVGVLIIGSGGHPLIGLKGSLDLKGLPTIWVHRTPPPVVGVRGKPPVIGVRRIP